MIGIWLATSDYQFPTSNSSSIRIATT